MDIGTIVIHLAHGIATVSRCDDSPNGLILTPATNALALCEAAAACLAAQEIDLHDDGLYLCSDQLQLAADLPLLSVPSDVIFYGMVRDILYPDETPNTGWQRLQSDVKAGVLTVYRIGVGADINRYVSRRQVEALAASRREGISA